MAKQPATRNGRLSEAARHVVQPSGLTATGWPAVRDKCRELGITFTAWQDGAGRLILSKRADGLYATTVGGVVISIPRQVGKTFLLAAVMFALCLLIPGFKVLWTAHRTRTADETFAAMQAFAKRLKVAPHVKRVRLTNGEQEIEFVNGSRIMFGARETGFGRGFANVDAEVFDESQILTEKAVDDMIPAMNQSPNPLLIFIGTPPKPSDPSEVFTNKRMQALSGTADDMAYIECSADEDCDPDDPAQWMKANPSFPDLTPATSIKRMRATLSDDSFLREALGVWNTSKSPRVIDVATWQAAGDVASMATDRLTLAVDVAPDRSVASVALAGQRPDGRWHIELDEHRSGTDWVGPWVAERAGRNQLHAVVADEMSGLVERRGGRTFLVGTDVAVTCAKSEGRDMAVACARFYDATIDGTLVHTDQPQVNVAMSVARKRAVGAGWAWNRRSTTDDITPLVAATLALWGAQQVTRQVSRPGVGRPAGNRRAVVLS